MAGGSTEAGVSVLRRAARVLRAVPDDGSPIAMPALAAAAELPVSTAHRLVAELVELGALERTAEGVAIGLALWELGERSQAVRALREAATPELVDLYDRTGENAHLAVLAGRDVLYLAKASGQRAIPTLSRVGLRHPLHTTGVGRAILAARDDAWLDDYLTRALPRVTVFTITDPAALRADVVRTRERGWAATRQEMTLGNVSFAVALRGRLGLPSAAIGIVAHSAVADESRLVPLIRRAAAAADARLDELLGSISH